MTHKQHQQRQQEARERALTFPTWEQYQQDFYKRYSAFLPHYEWCDSVGCEIRLDEAGHTPNCYTVHHTGTITVQALGEEYECQITSAGAPDYTQAEQAPCIETPPDAPATVHHKAGETVLALTGRGEDYDGLRLPIEHYATVKAHTLVEAYLWDGGAIEAQHARMDAIGRKIEEARKERASLIETMTLTGERLNQLGDEIETLSREWWKLILATHEVKEACLEQGRADMLKAGLL